MHRPFSCLQGHPARLHFQTWHGLLPVSTYADTTLLATHLNSPTQILEGTRCCTTPLVPYLHSC